MIYGVVVMMQLVMAVMIVVVGVIAMVLEWP